jgi:MFS family permease
MLKLANCSQWYLPHELALRMSIYNIAQPVGAMMSGAMQGALATNMDGTLGRAGWRWAFIINVRTCHHRRRR